MREAFADYATMGRVEDVVPHIKESGLSLVDHFDLPDEAWWDDRAVIVAEAPVLDEPKPQAFVETARAVVGRHRVDEDAVHGRVGEAAVDGQSHHLRAEPAAEERFLADSDVDGAQPGGAVAPVVTVFAGRVDDLDEANGRTFDFSDELFAPVGAALELALPAPVFGCPSRR